MAEDLRTQLRRPLPMALGLLAVLGWIVVIWLAVSNARVEDELRHQLELAEGAHEELVASIDALEGASGELSEIEERIGTGTADLAELTGQSEALQGDYESRLAQLTDELDTARRSFELELAQLEMVGAAARGKAQAGENRVADLEGEVQRIESEREQLRSDGLRAAERLMTQQAELGLAQHRSAEEAQRLAEVGDRLVAVREQSAEAQATLAELTEEASGLSADLAEAERRMQAAREAEADVGRQLTEARSEFSAMQASRDDLEQTIAQLQSRREELVGDVAAAEQQREQVQGQVAELTASLATRSEELAGIEERIASLQEEGASISEAGSAPMPPGVYSARGVTATFTEDGSFRMTDEAQARAVSGSYTAEDGVLTLLDGKGDVGTASFPMRCAVIPAEGGFELADQDGSCATLAGVTFAAEQPTSTP